MKKIICCFLILVSFGAYSQELKKPENKKKNTLSFEFYQPIQNSIREFYNDEWLLPPSLNGEHHYSRSAFSNAFGISYEKIKNNIVFRARLGLTIRDTKEHKYNLTVVPEENRKITTNENYVYTQKHINAFAGVAKRIRISDNFDFDLGIDLAYVSYLNGKGDYDFDSHQQSTIDNTTIERQTITIDDRIGRMYSVGFGPVLKPQYNITENLIVAAEFQIFFMRAFTNDKSTRLEIVDFIAPSENYSQHQEIPGELHYDVSQWNWTKISPLIRVGYQF